MIIGIGSDITDIDRVARLHGRFGHRFLARCYAEEEITKFKSFKDLRRAHEYLAKRFAAKEACVKAMGTGVRAGISLKDIVISNDAQGRPQIELRGRTGEISDRPDGRVHFHLSISDEPPYALAFVTAELRSA